MTDVTQILSAIEQGDPHAAAELLPLVYDELRRLAAAHLADEKPGQSLQPTALVHEAYIRLGAPAPAPHWGGRAHFFAAAAAPPPGPAPPAGCPPPAERAAGSGAAGWPAATSTGSTGPPRRTPTT